MHLGASGHVRAAPSICSWAHFVPQGFPCSHQGVYVGEVRKWGKEKLRHHLNAGMGIDRVLVRGRHKLLERLMESLRKRDQLY